MPLCLPAGRVFFKKAEAERFLRLCGYELCLCLPSSRDFFP